MSLLNRRNFCFSAIALTAGCGFEPVYGPSGSADSLRGSILVDAPEDKNEFDLTNQIEDRLGAPQNARFGLSVDIETRVEALAITQSQETTRYNVAGSADFTLRDLNTQQILTTGSAQNFTSFGATSDTVSTRSARADALRRLMVVLGNEISDQLIIDSTGFLP
ncbi:LPS assembly lipoprotein LptE [Falsihalocynthiibacter sp. SS001]|uniref:LPS assembly lipoprotein LptE n=1 Tax=Falsihalocynthiibacter sp. SS001 TaxID=3349698 RepID=UPI0036D43AF2